MASTAELVLLLKAKNLASREVDKLHGAMAKATGGASKFGSMLATVGKAAVLGLGAAVVGLAGFLVLATKKAADEQIGIAKLGAAIKANTKDHQVNTDAVEALITKREALAFSDDMLRTSLTTLIAKTHDLKSAQDLQATAMDLARLKGIDLNSASVLLTKGLDGSSKVLKQLGIDLPATATKQERLTAIQKIAAGQAEAYGKTAAGAQEAFQIAMDDVIEDIGSGLLPIMTAAFTWLREHAIPAVRDIVKRIGDWYDANRPLINQIRKFATDVLGHLISMIGTVIGWIGQLITAIANNKTAMDILSGATNGLADAMGYLAKGIQVVADWLGRFRIDVPINRKAVADLGRGWSAFLGVINNLVDGLKAVFRWAKDAIRMLSHLSDLIPRFNGISVGGFQTGTPFVPFTGPAIVHRGEAIIPADRNPFRGGAGGMGVTVVGISEADLLDMIDRGLYFRLQRAAPTLMRS